MVSADTAGKIIESMSSQVDLLTTLSVGICAGIVALYIHIVTHNHSKDISKLVLKWQSLLLTAFFIEGLSIVFGYFAYGAITDATPIIYSIPFEQGKTLVEYSYRNSIIIRALSITQFLFFSGGILCVFICLMKNRLLLK